MLNNIFIWILNQGIELGVIVLLLLPLRALLRKTAPRSFAYLLWGIIPINMVGSLLTKVYSKFLYWAVAVVDKSISLNLHGRVLLLCKWVLSVGIAVMVLYRIYSYLKLRKSLVGSIRLQENIYMTDRISAPFSMGVLHPRIYLPYSLQKEYYEPVILHEKVHIARKDLWMNYTAMLLLVLFWFQPVLWIAYPLFVKDMEEACDETVIRKRPMEFRACYAEALVEVSYQVEKVGAVVTGYGSGEIEGRITHVMTYKEPRLWMKLCMALVSVLFVLIAIPASRKTPHVFWLESENKETLSETNLRVEESGVIEKSGIVVEVLPLEE